MNVMFASHEYLLYFKGTVIHTKYKLNYSQNKYMGMNKIN